MRSLADYVVKPDRPVPAGGSLRTYINLDNAASTPAFTSVLDGMDSFMPWYSSVHRGNGFTSRLATEAYDEAHRILADFVGADEREHVVIFGKNTTEALNKLSYRLGLSKKDIVLISSLEHHSNDLPWRAHATVKRIGLTPTGGIDKADFQKQLQTYAGKIRLVAITGASNVTGHIPDIHWFAHEAHAAGAQIAVDCAQLAAHRPISMGRLRDPGHLDYITLSAHKMYAPFGTGALVGRRDTFEKGSPEYRGGGTIDVVTTRSVDWTSPPDKDEAGSPNVVGAVALAIAAKTIKTIGFDRIVKHESALLGHALAELKTVPGLTLYGPAVIEESADRSGVIPFTLEKVPPHLIAAVLGFEWAIGVRSGCFCAQPYVAKLMGLDDRAIQKLHRDVVRGRRDLAPGMVRISFGLYNTEQEIDTLIKALTAIAAGDYGEYLLNRKSGAYTPLVGKEDFSGYFAL